MYNIKLDENNYYTDSYAKVGKVEGGINISTLPPTDDTKKALCYKYDYHDVTIITQQPIIKEVMYDEYGLEIINDIEDVEYENVETITSELGWFFDADKYDLLLNKNLYELKSAKLKELSEICNQSIIKGIKVTTSHGEENFRLTSDDQRNIQDNMLDIFMGAKEAMYHPDGNGDNYRMFSVEEMTLISDKAKEHKLYHATRFNELKAKVLSCVTEEDVNNIQYDMELA